MKKKQTKNKILKINKIDGRKILKFKDFVEKIMGNNFLMYHGVLYKGEIIFPEMIWNWELK